MAKRNMKPDDFSSKLFITLKIVTNVNTSSPYLQNQLTGIGNR